MAKKTLVPEELKKKQSELFEVDGVPFRVSYLPKAGINRLLDWVEKIGTGDIMGYDLKTCADIRNGENHIGTAQQASIEDLETAYLSFLNVCLLYTKRELMLEALKNAPRKKNGTLTLKRVQHLAYIPYGIGLEFYELCAINETDNTMLLEIRKATCSHRNAEAVSEVPSCEEIIQKWGSVLPEFQCMPAKPKEKKAAAPSPEEKAGFIIERKILRQYTGGEDCIVIPDGVTKIIKGAIPVDKTIKQIVIPDSVVEIADDFVSPMKWPVSTRPSVQRIDFMSGIKKLPGLHYVDLHEMTIPDELPAKAVRSSGLLTNLEKLYVRDSSPLYKVVDDCLLSKDGKILYFYPYVKEGECRVPDGVETIADNVFGEAGGGWYAMTNKVVLPSTVRSIGYRAFSSPKLKEVVVPASVQEIDQYAFSGYYPEFIMLGEKGSVAEQYAQERNIQFREI